MVTSGLPVLDWRARFAARTALGGGDLTAILAAAGASDTIAFSGGFPAPETFPVRLLEEVLTDLLEHDAARALQYSPTEGLLSSRTAVAEFLLETQGVRPDPAGVLVTSGGIEALELLTRVFLEEGDCVYVEAPSYLGALMAFRGAGATVRGVPLDGDGLSVDHLAASLAGESERPKLLYVIPDHQNPTGLSLSPERRQELVALCRRERVLIIEDVAYRELGFDGRAAESLWSIDPEVVVQIGTFSKILFPGVRLGWAVGPSPVVEAMAGAKQNSDQCSGALGQRIMSALVPSSRFSAHLSTAREIYAGRAQVMLESLERHMPPGTMWTTPRGGFFVWLTAPEGCDARLLASAAREEHVAFVPGEPFYPGPGGSNQMRLAYSGVRETDIEEGVARLARLIRAESRRSA